MADEILSLREIRRYDQQIILDGIGKHGQETIKLSRVLVIGAGGKGTSALKNLITAGVGYIGISDDSLVQEDTLGRQTLFGDNDIGKQKAIVSKQYLKARNGFSEIKVHNIRLTSENLNSVIKDYHLIVDATNNYNSHYAVSKAAIEGNKPVVFSSINGNKGIVTTLNYQNKRSLEEAMPNENNFDISNPDTSTPVVIVNSITGALMAAEALKIILGQKTILCEKFLVFDASNYSFTLIE